MAANIKKRKKQNEESSKIRLDELGENISIADIDIKDLLYQPKSELTAAVYGHIIKFVRDKLGFQHNSIINGAADEVIGTMKDPNFDEETRRSEVTKLLSPDEDLDDEEYNRLCNLCKKIDDWDSARGKVNEDTAEEETGVIGAIVSDDEDEDDEYVNEIRDSDDDFDLDEMFEESKKDGDRLDLEELAKKQSSIVPRIDLGEPIRKDGYQEYHIAPKKRPSYQTKDLMRLSDLPDDISKAFGGGFKELNYIQSKIYRRAIESDDSLLICAPTGAGKTNIAMLTILRVMRNFKNRDGSGYRKDKFKIIYVAPIKALVQEVVQNFNKRLGKPPYELVVDELTGDHQLDQKQISRAQLIVCTPEKWDIVTRKSLDRLYTKLVKLVIFDEIHLLHNERGATLEALVARIKRHKDMEGDPIRIVGLSATLPNYKDVAKFIHPKGADDGFVDDATFYFDSSHRPIPLKQQYIALTESKKVFRMINDIVYEKVVERLPENSQILIFVHSRPDTTKTAEYIKTKALEEHRVAHFISSESVLDKINEYENELSPKLRELLQFGIGTHHAGMSKQERSCVEDLFRSRYIKVLVSTATLAWGVNLPARTVIIKGTQVYRDGRWTDLDSLDVTQMLGRAGRPGFDREGEGIVITQQSKVAFYISLMTEQLPIESRLIGRLAEYVNAECVVGNIESLDGAVDWISETYLNSRMKSVLLQDNLQYMALYGLKPEARQRDPELSGHRHSLAYNAASILDERGLIVFDRASGAISSTELGRIASNFNCSSRTIKLFYDSIHEYTSDVELFRIFSLADEFKDIFVRRGEEADLATMLNQVPFPIDDKRATPGANKVNVLLQVYIFRLNIEGSDLICDMHFIKDNAARLARAIHEIVLLKGYAYVAELSLDLCRKIDLRMTSCHSPLRQFAEDLDQNIISRLERKNYHIDELRVLKADKLAELLRCDHKIGDQVYKILKYLPKIKIEASIKPISKSSLRVDLSIVPAFSWSDRYHHSSERFWLMVQDVNQERLLHYEILTIRKHLRQDSLKVSFFVPYLVPIHPFYYLRIFPDRWFGCDHHLPIYIERITLPDDGSATTQLADADPISVSALRNRPYEKYYEQLFGGADFNQIQTQNFNLFYESDDDVILLASAGSGKTVCAELAIIRAMNQHQSDFKCGYVAANSQACEFINKKWSNLFGDGVLMLTGNHRADVARVDSSIAKIVVGSPNDWHILSLLRSKKTKKLFNKFKLFIIDDIHCLYNDKSSTFEWLCSKLRILTKLAEVPPRLITLGSPMTCADSLRTWLAFARGNKEPVVLNYPPGIRPVKLDLSIQRYHHDDYNMRLLTMKRPIYRLISQMSKGKQAILFVGDAYTAEDLSTTLIYYALHEKRPFSRPRTSASVDHVIAAKFAQSTNREVDDANHAESRLIECLDNGVGFIYQGMDPRMRQVVEELYSTNQISILVATVASCWSIGLRSYLTVVMDTQYHDGRETIDYDLTDIVQMIGLTGRPLADHDCRCVIMCHYSKADYYERFLREPLPSESYLPANLINHVNFEIATGTIVELNNIYKPYLAHTFFYKRISINPNYYGIVVPDDSENKAKVFANFFNNLVNNIAKELRDKEFISVEGNLDNPTFTSNLIAKISLEYHLCHKTLLNYNKWLNANTEPSQIKPLELIELISSNTIEFDRIRMKYGEMQDLKYLQRRHRPNEGDQLSNSNFKIKLLILSQYQKTNGKEDDVFGELISDRQFVIATSHRLLMAIVDIAWLRDSYHLAKAAIQLAKKLSPFKRQTKPNIEMDINVSKNGDMVRIDATIKREDRPFCVEEFMRDSPHLPANMYRDEGWCFLINGRQKSSKKDDLDKFILFKRVKTPNQGDNEYKLDFEITANVDSYTYDLYFMSDFYSTSEDRRVADIDITSILE